MLSTGMPITSCALPSELCRATTAAISRSQLGVELSSTLQLSGWAGSSRAFPPPETPPGQPDPSRYFPSLILSNTRRVLLPNPKMCTVNSSRPLFHLAAGPATLTTTTPSRKPTPPTFEPSSSQPGANSVMQFLPSVSREPIGLFYEHSEPGGATPPAADSWPQLSLPSSLSERAVASV